MRLLGQLRVQHGAHAATAFGGLPPARLLAYLVYYPNRSHPRDQLAELLWPGCRNDEGHDRLNVVLFKLRGRLKQAGVPVKGLLIADRQSLGLDPAVVTTDAALLMEALKSARRCSDPALRAEQLASVVDLYGGDLLPGLDDDWVLRERQRLADDCVAALAELAALRRDAGDLPGAIDAARRAVTIDPLREEPRCDLMRLLAMAGRHREVLREYEELRRMLKTELGAFPSSSARALAAASDRAAANPPPLPRGADNRLADDASPRAAGLAPARGALPLDSPVYVARPVDQELATAINRHESCFLLKGARQVGKSSLLARGLQHAREREIRAQATDLHALNSECLQSADALLLALARHLAERLDLARPEESWEADALPNENFGRYMRRVVLAEPLLWALDGADALLVCPLGGAIFSMFRAWHNERALDPSGPWPRLTLLIAYATEPHLFIRDLNRSPFNVGTRLLLSDFDFRQVEELNRRCGEPLREEADLRRFYRLTGGHPYLAQEGLRALAAGGVHLGELERDAGGDGSFFVDHLRPLRMDLKRDPDLCDVVRRVLRGEKCPSEESFWRLRAAGVLAGESSLEARPRCGLYASYFTRCPL